jgi:hypothetical protein
VYALVLLGGVLPGVAAAADEVAALPGAGACLSTAHLDVTIPVVFDRADATEAVGASVTFSLSSNLELYGGTTASIEQGTWLDAFTDVTYQVIDEGGGVYTVDQAILGAADCGVTTGGTLFTIHLVKAPAATDGTGTITVTAVDVRSCTNQPLPGSAGDPGTFPIDLTPPPAITDLTTTQVKTGNGSSGRTGIELSWTDPAAPDLSRVRIYRRGFGSYPEYDDLGGAAPAVPADSVAANTDWAKITDNGVSPKVDNPPVRDFWYYVAYSFDDCGNYSAVSNLSVDGTRTSNDPVSGTLNYILGDFAGTGDNLVNVTDLSALANAYGRQDGQPNYNALVDVGPTSDLTVDGLPETDNRIQFQDLLMFALTFGAYQVGAPAPELLAADVPGSAPELEVALERLGGDRFRARLLLAGNPGTLKGVHAILAHPGAAVESVTRGSLLGAQAGEVFFTHLRDEEVEGAGRARGVGIHLAILGEEIAIHGQGELATIVFRGDAAGLALAHVDLRDLGNRSLGGQTPAAIEEPAAALPIAAEFLGAQPNPFNPATTLRFRLPAAERVTLRIYDVSGQLVATLLDAASLPAGEHAIAWNGRDAGGSAASSGIYFARFAAGSFAAGERIVLLK